MDSPVLPGIAVVAIIVAVIVVTDKITNVSLRRRVWKRRERALLHLAWARWAHPITDEWVARTGFGDRRGTRFVHSNENALAFISYVRIPSDRVAVSVAGHRVVLSERGTEAVTGMVTAKPLELARVRRLLKAKRFESDPSLLTLESQQRSVEALHGGVAVLPKSKPYVGRIVHYAQHAREPVTLLMSGAECVVLPQHVPTLLALLVASSLQVDKAVGILKAGVPISALDWLPGDTARAAHNQDYLDNPKDSGALW